VSQRPQHHVEPISGNPAVRARVARDAAPKVKPRKDWTDEEIVADWHRAMRRTFKGLGFPLKERLRALRRAQARIEAEGGTLPLVIER
jgi:hypothetical protein